MANATSASASSATNVMALASSRTLAELRPWPPLTILVSMILLCDVKRQGGWRQTLVIPLPNGMPTAPADVVLLAPVQLDARGLERIRHALADLIDTVLAEQRRDQDVILGDAEVLRPQLVRVGLAGRIPHAP